MWSSISTLFRLPNLIIVGLSQLAVYYIFLLPIFAKYNLTPVLQGHLIPLFILVTVLIAAGGYLINNIIDIKADSTNRPNFSAKSASFLSSKKSVQVYSLIVIIGMVLAIYIAYSIGKLKLTGIYYLATFVLLYYSLSFKSKPLVGNIVVAIFCAFVPGIVWFAESDTIAAISSFSAEDHQRIIMILIAYMTFGFFATISREIVKDIEDIEGDKLSGYNTLPISIGVEKSKVTAIFNTVLLIISYFLWVIYANGNEFLVLSILVGTFLVLPSIWWLIKLNRAKEKSDYTSLSKWMKYIMIISLIIFLCIPYIRYNI